MSDTAFRGTLLLLQNRTRRDPESYREEFLAQLDHFQALSATVEANGTENAQYIAVLNYISHVIHCYPKEACRVSEAILGLLRRSKGGLLHSSMRIALIKALALLRSKDLVALDETFPILFQLLQERDKGLRKFILAHLVSDIRRVNLPAVKNGALINKKAQNYLFAVMEEDDAVQARCAQIVMIDLYRRRVWCNDRTVEVMTAACFSKHTKILRTALRFFLMQMPKVTSVDDSDDDEAEKTDPGRTISKMKQKLKIVKKTAKRERVLKREMNRAKRKYDKEQQKEEEFAKQHVDPIRLLRDPHQFVERLLARLQKTSERFEVRILYLNVIARVITEHEVVHLPLYNFLERYMEPAQLHVTELLALSSMCIHPMVPPDAVEPLIKAIANHFVTDRSTPDAITIGINTIREMCKRQPLAMNETLLKDLVEYKSQRGDRGVIMAARALLQLYREVNPDLLPAKLRGSKAGPATEGRRPVFGTPSPLHSIPGMELLLAASHDDLSDGTGSSDDSSSDSDSDSGDWVTDSEDVDASDIEGDFVDVSNSSDESTDDDDECPQLVDVGSKRADGSVKRKRVADAASSASAVLPSKKTRLEESGTTVDDSSCSDAGDSDDDDEMIHISDSEEGEWEEASGDEEEDSDEEDEGDEESAVSEDEESGDDDPSSDAMSIGDSVADAVAASGEWVEDASARTTRTPSQAGSASSKASRTSSMADRLLTDEDFVKIRKLQQQNGGHRSLRLKEKEKEARKKRKNELLHDISADLTSREIEHFTEKKREADREERIAQALEKRQGSSKFEIRRKTKSKLNSTHGEHSKRGKLFQMTKRSQRVAAKLKSSAQGKQERRNEMKKKDIKFRIKRGWKA